MYKTKNIAVKTPDGRLLEVYGKFHEGYCEGVEFSGAALRDIPKDIKDEIVDAIGDMYEPTFNGEHIDISDGYRVFKDPS